MDFGFLVALFLLTNFSQVPFPLCGFHYVADQHIKAGRNETEHLHTHVATKYWKQVVPVPLHLLLFHSWNIIYVSSGRILLLCNYVDGLLLFCRSVVGWGHDCQWFNCQQKTRTLILSLFAVCPSSGCSFLASPWRSHTTQAAVKTQQKHIPLLLLIT